MTGVRQYITHLEQQLECPLCGSSPLARFQGAMRRFECGAVFAVSEITNDIVASEPCSLASAEAARLMNMQARKAVAS